MSEREKNKAEIRKALKQLVALLIMLPISLVASGWIIQLLWNDVLVTELGLPTISLVGAIALDTLITFILGIRDNKERPFEEVIVRVITINSYFLAIALVLSALA